MATHPSLAARCPACRTVFRVVPDQLRVSEGWVRCGRCSEVFNATESLVDVETGAARRAPDAAPPNASRSAGAGLAPAAPAEPAPAPAQPRASARPDPDIVGAGPDLPAAAQPPAGFVAETAPVDSDPVPAAATLQASDPRAEPDDKPGFVRQAERAERWRRPRVRALLVTLAVLGVLGLSLQAAHAWRDLLAAHVPAARPALQWACAEIGCAVEPVRLIGALAVESSGLVRVEKSSIYRLQVALRNNASIELALPALDLSLTDSQGHLIARKVLRTAELGVSEATIGAGRELMLQATLQAAAPAPNPSPVEPVAGYTIELFYP